MDGSGVITVRGEGRELSGRETHNRALRVDLGDDRLTLSLEGDAPLAAAYRDLTTVAVQQGQVLLVLGADSRFVVERLGERLGTLVAELRERRARQLLADRLIDLPTADELELAEYRAGDEHGVAQIAFHGWGAALLPLDERRPQRLLRRADITAVEAYPAHGSLRVAAGESLELLGLGQAVERARTRWAGLREAALADAASIVGALLPDAPFDLRRRAGSLLVDGRPVERAELGDSWPALEAAVLSEPVFAASYRALAERGGGPRWIALAPARPSRPGEPPAEVTPHVAWFFVGLPGSLLAMEIVSAGAHATYLFRATEPARAVAEVSAALIDGRFLRAPIYLDEGQLADARHLRYRLAIAALPSLRAARARFVGRVIHRDDVGWQAALDDAIAWSTRAGDGAGRWPGAATGDETETDTDTADTTEEP